MRSYEQQARDMLEGMGWEQAQQLSSGDVIEVANLLVSAERLRTLENAMRSFDARRLEVVRSIDGSLVSVVGRGFPMSGAIASALTVQDALVAAAKAGDAV